MNIRNRKFCQELADDILELVARGVVRPTAIARVARETVSIPLAPDPRD